MHIHTFKSSSLQFLLFAAPFLLVREIFHVSASAGCEGFVLVWVSECGLHFLHTEEKHRAVFEIKCVWEHLETAHRKTQNTTTYIL